MPAATLPSWNSPFPWAEAAILAGGFVWGAMLGSFLNVVVHRVPRGASIVHGRSRCPRCGAAVRPRDNVPVLGWLFLRGRCRDCAEPISARYPLVEAGCGLIVAAVAAVDLVHGGIDRMLLRGDWLPWARFACHGLALLTLVAWTLIAASGSRVPKTATVVAVVVAGLAAVALPAVQPVGALPAGSVWPADQPRLAALVAWLAGTTAGWIASRCGRSPAAAAFVLLGAAFGWQTVTVVEVLAALVRLGWRRARSLGGLSP
jgi:prepilin signal peptidase PulO-like enzyme (type II secretory pathway)